MLTSAEFLLSIQSLAEGIAQRADGILADVEYLNSALPTRPASSHTAQTESAGAGSVSATTGPTEERWTEFRRRVFALVMEDADFSRHQSRILDMLEAARYCLDSGDSASGTAESQPPRSVTPQAPARGVSSDPTLPPSVSALTDTKTRIDWNAVRLTVVGRLSGTRAGSVLTIDCLTAVMERVAHALDQMYGVR